MTDESRVRDDWRAVAEALPPLLPVFPPVFPVFPPVLPVAAPAPALFPVMAVVVEDAAAAVVVEPLLPPLLPFPPLLPLEPVDPLVFPLEAAVVPAAAAAVVVVPAAAPLLPFPALLLEPPDALSVDAEPAAVVVIYLVTETVCTTVLIAIVAVLQNVSVSNDCPLAGRAWAEKVEAARVKRARQVDLENMMKIRRKRGRDK
jgi:hypothetical protein